MQVQGPTCPDREPLSAPESLSEQSLLDGLRARTPEAFELLLDRYEMPLFRFFFYSHGSHDLAQDQCGETFAALVHAIPRMRGDGSSLKAFIFAVARNVQRRRWREKRIREVPIEHADLMPDPGRSPHEEASRRQLFEHALCAIAQFPDPARQVLLLRFVEDLKLEEVAHAMKLPLNSVKSIVRRSCRTLRKSLSADALSQRKP